MGIFIYLLGVLLALMLATLLRISLASFVFGNRWRSCIDSGDAFVIMVWGVLSWFGFLLLLFMILFDRQFRSTIGEGLHSIYEEMNN